MNYRRPIDLHDEIANDCSPHNYPAIRLHSEIFQDPPTNNCGAIRMHYEIFHHRSIQTKVCCGTHGNSAGHDADELQILFDA